MTESNESNYSLTTKGNTMDNDAIARKLISFGNRKAKIAAAMTRRAAQLEKVCAEECAFLCSLVPDAGLSPDVATQSVAAKDGGGN